MVIVYECCSNNRAINHCCSVLNPCACGCYSTPVVLDPEGLAWRWLQQLHDEEGGMEAIEAEDLTGCWSDQKEGEKNHERYDSFNA